MSARCDILRKSTSITPPAFLDVKELMSLLCKEKLDAEFSHYLITPHFWNKWTLFVTKIVPAKDHDSYFSIPGIRRPLQPRYQPWRYSPFADSTNTYIWKLGSHVKDIPPNVAIQALDILLSDFQAGHTKVYCFSPLPLHYPPFTCLPSMSLYPLYFCVNWYPKTCQLLYTMLLCVTWFRCLGIYVPQGIIFSPWRSRSPWKGLVRVSTPPQSGWGRVLSLDTSFSPFTSISSTSPISRV